MGTALKIEFLAHNGTYWHATVYLPIPPDGVTITLDRKHGSWHRVDGTRRYEPPVGVAATLQHEVRTRERREARASA